MGIWQQKGSIITQRKDNDVRECICEIAQSIRISNTHSVCIKQCDFVLDYSITQINELASKWELLTQYMVGIMNHDGHKLKVAPNLCV